MTKYILPAIAFTLLSACQPGAAVSDRNNGTDKTSADFEIAVYKGVLPAADCPGIEYSLSLDKGNNEYDMLMTYIDAEGPGKSRSFTSTGKFQLTENDSISYYCLKQDDDRQSTYFKIINDSTLRLINDRLQEAATRLNYDIVKIKDRH